MNISFNKAKEKSQVKKKKKAERQIFLSHIP